MKNIDATIDREIEFLQAGLMVLDELKPKRLPLRRSRQRCEQINFRATPATKRRVVALSQKLGIHIADLMEIVLADMEREFLTKPRSKAAA
jgi:hypothetical protein